MTKAEKLFTEKILIPLPRGIKERLLLLGQPYGASMTQTARNILMTGLKQMEHDQSDQE